MASGRKKETNGKDAYGAHLMCDSSAAITLALCQCHYSSTEEERGHLGGSLALAEDCAGV